MTMPQNPIPSSEGMGSLMVDWASGKLTVLEWIYEYTEFKGYTYGQDPLKTVIQLIRDVQKKVPRMSGKPMIKVAVDLNLTCRRLILNPVALENPGNNIEKSLVTRIPFAISDYIDEINAMSSEDPDEEWQLYMVQVEDCNNYILDRVIVEARSPEEARQLVRHSPMYCHRIARDGIPVTMMPKRFREREKERSLERNRGYRRNR